MAGADTRIKDIPTTTTSPASDDYYPIDGATNGTRRILHSALATNLAATFVAAATTYKLVPLNGSNKIDSIYLPTLPGSYLGVHNVSTNSPTVADGSGTAGQYYRINPGGTRDYGSGNITLTTSDVLVYSGSVWQKVPGVANIFDGTSTTSGAATAGNYYEREDVNDRQLSKQPSNGLHFDDNTSNVVSLGDDPKLSFGDGSTSRPLTLAATMNAEDLTSFPVMAKYGAGDSTREYLLWFEGADKLQLTLVDSSAGIYINAKADVASTDLEGNAIHVAATFSAASANSSAADDIALYINGEAVAVTATNSGSFGGLEDTAESFQVGRSGTGGALADGVISSSLVFNRALSAAEVATLAANGNVPAPTDQWGNDTSIFTGDSSTFASSLGNWTKEGGSTHTVIQSGGKMQLTDTSGATGTRGARNLVSPLSEGQWYRIEFKTQATSGTGAISVKLFNASTFQWRNATSAFSVASGAGSEVGFTPTGSETTESIEILIDGGGTDYLFLSLGGASGDGEVLTIDDITAKPSGAVVALLPQNISEATWVDASTNRLDGAITGATVLNPQKRLDLDDTDAATGDTILNVGTGFKVEKDGDVIARTIELSPSSAGNVAVGQQMIMVNTGDFVGSTGKDILTSARGQGFFCIGTRQSSTDFRSEMWAVNIEDDTTTVNAAKIGGAGTALTTVSFTVSSGKLNLTMSGHGSSDTQVFGMFIYT